MYTEHTFDSAILFDLDDLDTNTKVVYLDVVKIVVSPGSGGVSYLDLDLDIIYPDPSLLRICRLHTSQF